MIHPRRSSYSGNGKKNFLTATHGYRSVFTRDRFLSVWKFWHLVDEENADLDKTDKLYKVQPLLNSVLAKFKHYYYPAQKICIDEGMIPAKNRLGIKQHIG